MSETKHKEKYGVFMRCATCKQFLGSCFIYDGQDFIAYCGEHQPQDLVQERLWRNKK